MTLHDAHRTVSRHRRKSLGFFVATMAVVVLATLFWPRQYRSEGELFVRLGRENATLDPTATLGQGPVVAVPPTRESEINSVVEVLKSRVLLEQAIDRIGPEVVLGRASRRTEQSPDDPDAAAVRDEAIRKATKKLSVEAVKRSNVVRVSYDAYSPATAQEFVAGLIEDFRREHIRLNRVPESRTFLDEQSRRLKADLASKEDELRDLKSRVGFVDVPTQRKILLERLGRLEDDSLQVSVARKTAEAEVRALRQKLDSLPSQTAAETKGRTNQGTDGMRQQCYALHLKEEELAAMYTDAHPKMREIRQQVEAAEKILRREEQTRTEVTTAPSHPHEETTLALLREEAMLASLEAKARTVDTQLAEARSQLSTLNENELKVARLQREAELQEASYRKYAQTSEQARIDEALGLEKISNIGVVQPATYDAKPVKPWVLANLALGFAVAVCGSFGLAVLADARDHTPRTSEGQPRGRRPGARGRLSRRDKDGRGNRQEVPPGRAGSA